ncbi:ADOP family duplicated permease [Roseisolibacter sp. H3M3-2]|uniref:ADOP family duplicated permease n=1 Tax=Roseisolibacter sp. H3M3-2 TaxID=3031323 RepID=UPI0023DBBA4D|nr:ADOP family duplicated permease [Roseisolibacter sp. H3M3-2]MDF1502363.1 ADOP family duplicated permease [Roseisolibacter sp. H3M3-2]
MPDPIARVRVALRSLRRTPGFSAAAALTLALGIGLATAVFTVANALLVRDLPMRDQDGVAVLWAERRDGSFAHLPFALDDARAFAAGSRAVRAAAYAAYEGARPAAVLDGTGLTRLARAHVSGNFFDVLGARPLLGRALRPEDDVVGAAPVIVLSHAAWRRQFGGDPAAVGRSLRLHADGVAHTVVGVMPPGLDLPRGTDFWAPLVPAKTIPGTDSVVAHVDVVARLAPGAAPGAAAAEVTRWYATHEGPAWLADLRGVATPAAALGLGDARPALLAFAAASALLLLVTCLDVANLLLARGLGREREVAVRAALGADRARVVGELLTEHALLAAIGGVLGAGVAWAAVRGFVALAPAGLPRLEEVRPDAAALLLAVAVTGAATLLFAVAPAVVTSNVDVQVTLRAGARDGARRGARALREGLVAAQVALALVVLSAAALLGRTMRNLETADLAFDGERLLVAELALRQDAYDTPAKQAAMLDQLLPAVRALPGVRGASPVVAVPYAGSGGWDGRLEAEGQDARAAAANPLLNMEVVTPDYFATLGLPLLRGRAFAESDRQGALPVVMLSESAARFYWGGADAVGKRLQLGPPQARRAFTVVGVVPETRYRDLREARPSVYFPLAQSFFPFTPTTLVIRAAGTPATVAPALRAAIAEAAPGVALASATPFETLRAALLAQLRLNALLLACFAGAAVLLAAVGLAGTMATTVRQRTRELGVRMALGASGRDVAWLVVRRALVVSAAGAGFGLLGALAANRALAVLLYGVAPTDAGTLAVVVVVLLAVSAVAALLPARSGARIEPIQALRAE